MIVQLAFQRAGRRVLAALAAAGMLSAAIAGCGSSNGQPGAGQQAAASAWQLTMNRVQPGGSVSTATALAAFALAIGPVPGARALTGPAQDIPSGTIAVQWVLGHWAGLTAGQRRAVLTDLGVRPTLTAVRSGRQPTTATLDAALTSHAAAGKPAAKPVSPDIPCLTADSAGAAAYQAQAAGIESQLATQIGDGPFSPDVYFSVNKTQLAGAKTLMYTYGCTSSQVTSAGPVTGCTIHVNPLMASTGFSAAEVRDVLIHELTHCYLFLKLGAAYYSMPSWYVEGVPTWTMTALGGGNSVEGKFWLSYLNSPGKPVFQRAYDALGFYAHLAETGTDVWHKIIPMGQAIISGGNAAGWAAAAPSQQFLDSWGPGYAEGRYPGTAWQTSGPNLPHYQGPIPQQSLGDNQAITVSSPAAAVAITHVDIDAQVVMFSGTASGMLSLDGGADTTLASAAGTVYSTAGTTCPSGTADAGDKLTPLSSGMHYIGLTGGLAAGSVSVKGLSLQAFCATKTTPCLVGTWTSTEFQATVTSVFSEQGAAGTVLRIAPDGTFSIEFAQMQPVSVSGQDGMAAHFTFGGTVTGEALLPTSPGAATGAWQAAPGTSIDYGSLTATIDITSPISDTIGPLNLSDLASQFDGSAASSPVGDPLSSGSWSCSGNTLVNRPPASAPFSGTWTWTRTG